MLLAILYTNTSNLFFGIQIILRMTQCSGIWYFLPQVVNFSDKRTSSVQPVAQFWTKIVIFSSRNMSFFRGGLSNISQVFPLRAANLLANMVLTSVDYDSQT